MSGAITVAMQSGIGTDERAHVIHPDPAVAEAIRLCGDADNCNRLTPAVKCIFGKCMALERSP